MKWLRHFGEFLDLTSCKNTTTHFFYIWNSWIQRTHTHFHRDLNTWFSMVLKIGSDQPVRPPTGHRFSPIRSIGLKIGWIGIRPVEPNGSINIYIYIYITLPFIVRTAATAVPQHAVTPKMGQFPPTAWKPCKTSPPSAVLVSPLPSTPLQTPPTVVKPPPDPLQLVGANVWYFEIYFLLLIFNF